MRPLKKKILNYLFILLFSSIVVACGSGGGDGVDTVKPVLPPDATRFTAANSSTVARSAADSLVQTEAVIYVREAEAAADTGNEYRHVIAQAFNRSSDRAVRETIDCSGGGNGIADIEKTDTAESGTVSFNHCDIGGVTIDGSTTFSLTFDDTTGAYATSGDGSLTVSASGQSATIALNYSQSGNILSGEFSADVTLSATGDNIANYSLTTTRPITGVGSEFTGGEVLVEGADDTRLRITFKSNNTAYVSLDDGEGVFESQESITF